jgi:hypothetical protein
MTDLAPVSPSPWDLAKLKERAAYWVKRSNDTREFQTIIQDQKTRKPLEDQRPILQEQAEIERDYKAAIEHTGRNDGVDDKDHPEIGRPWSGNIDIVRSRMNSTIARFERFPEIKALFDKARGQPLKRKVLARAVMSAPKDHHQIRIPADPGSPLRLVGRHRGLRSRQPHRSRSHRGRGRGRSP